MKSGLSTNMKSKILSSYKFDSYKNTHSNNHSPFLNRSPIRQVVCIGDRLPQIQNKIYKIVQSGKWARHHNNNNKNINNEYNMMESIIVNRRESKSLSNFAAFQILDARNNNGPSLFKPINEEINGSDF